MKKTQKISLFLLIASMFLISNISQSSALTNYFAYVEKSDYIYSTYDSKSTVISPALYDSVFAHNSSINFAISEENIEKGSLINADYLISNNSIYNEKLNESINTNCLEVYNANNNSKITLDSNFRDDYNQFLNTKNVNTIIQSEYSIPIDSDNLTLINCLPDNSVEQNSILMNDSSIENESKIIINFNETRDFYFSFRIMLSESFESIFFHADNQYFAAIYNHKIMLTDGITFLELNTLNELEFYQISFNFVEHGTKIEAYLNGNIIGSFENDNSDKYINRISLTTRLDRANFSCLINSIIISENLLISLSNYYDFKNMYFECIFKLDSELNSSISQIINFTFNSKTNIEFSILIEEKINQISNLTEFIFSFSNYILEYNLFYPFYDFDKSYEILPYYFNRTLSNNQNPIYLGIEFDYINLKMNFNISELTISIDKMIINEQIDFSSSNSIQKDYLYNLMFRTIDIYPTFNQNHGFIYAIDSNIKFKMYDLSDFAYNSYIYENYVYQNCKNVYDMMNNNSFYDMKPNELFTNYQFPFTEIANTFDDYGYYDYAYADSSIYRHKNLVHNGKSISPLHENDNLTYEVNFAFDSNAENFVLTSIFEFRDNYSIVYWLNDYSYVKLTCDYFNSTLLLPKFKFDYVDTIRAIYHSNYVMYVNGENTLENQVYFSLMVNSELVDSENDYFSVMSIIYDEMFYAFKFENVTEPENFNEKIRIQISNRDEVYYLYEPSNPSHSIDNFNLIGLKIDKFESDLITEVLKSDFALVQSFSIENLTFHNSHDSFFLTEYFHSFNYEIDEPYIPISISDEYRIQNAKIKNLKWNFQSIISLESSIALSNLSYSLIGKNSTYDSDDLVQLNNSDYIFNLDQTENFSLTINIQHRLLGYSEINQNSIVFVNLTTTWLCLLEEYESIINFALKIFEPMLLIFIFPFIFGKKWGKWGFGLGLIFSILIYSISDYLTIAQTILLMIIAITLLAVIIFQKRNENGGYHESI